VQAAVLIGFLAAQEWTGGGATSGD
jgi:uncharacterized protein involved in response to NO